MKKSRFVAMILGTVSGVLFALGMCMALLPEWNSMKPGIIFGVIGLVLALITVIVWRKMENKAPIKITPKAFGISALAIIGSLLLGVGMCFVLVWSKMVIGIIIGLLGIIALLSLIPVCKGLK